MGNGIDTPLSTSLIKPIASNGLKIYGLDQDTTSSFELGPTSISPRFHDNDELDLFVVSSSDHYIQVSF